MKRTDQRVDDNDDRNHDRIADVIEEKRDRSSREKQIDQRCLELSDEYREETATAGFWQCIRADPGQTLARVRRRQAFAVVRFHGGDGIGNV